MRVTRGVLLLGLVTILLLLIAERPAPSNEDQFMPPRLAYVQAVGCEAVADKLEQQAYVEVYAKHAEEPGWDYQVIIARRDSPEAAFDDCAKWYKDLKSALQKERNRK